MHSSGTAGKSNHPDKISILQITLISVIETLDLHNFFQDVWVEGFFLLAIQICHLAAILWQGMHLLKGR